MIIPMTCTLPSPHLPYLKGSLSLMCVQPSANGRYSSCGGVAVAMGTQSVQLPF